MRVAAILGLGCSLKNLRPFQFDQVPANGCAENIEWRMCMPASGDDADVILLFGGDGTIHRHLGQLVKLGLPVLVVPAGSGNDFARALGLRRVHDSLAAWRKFCCGAADDGVNVGVNIRANVRAIDLGVIRPLDAETPSPLADPTRNSEHGTRYFCCVAGVGLDGEVAARANRLPRWLRGHGGYVLSLAPSIFTFAPLPTKILTSAQVPAENPLESSPPVVCPANRERPVWTTRSDRPSILAAFANTPLYGGGMKIAPRAKMDDGLLDVCIVGAVSRLRLLRLFPSVYSGNHLNVPEVEYFQTCRVRVETEHPLDVYADGEYVCQTPVELGIQRGALRVIVHESQTRSAALRG
jgi:diacylglycerol kinase (ATP)